MAISASSYSVGNRVYRGGSSAPTMGTVDPSGYVERELNNVASQSRSGLAAAALRRLKGPQSPAERAGVNVDRQRSLGGPGGWNPGAGGGGPALPARGGGQAGAVNRIPTPALNMSNTGKLNVPNLGAAAGGTGLPFDPDAADAQETLLGQKNRFEQQMNDAQYGLNRDYTTKKRMVEDEQPDAQRALLEDYAGRGLAYSSGYAYDYGDLSSQYANLLAELEGGKTEGLANLLRQRGLFSEEYATQLQNIQEAAARRAAANAGDLGLGTPGQGILDSLMPPAQPYDNRYNQPGYNPNPSSPVVAAPNTAGRGVGFGPGRNIRPNPTYVAPSPVPAATGGISQSPFKRSWSRR